jgi:hypothetical protein
VTALVLDLAACAIIGAVHDTPGAIGYVGVSYLSTVTKDGEVEVALGNALEPAAIGRLILARSRRNAE